MGKGKADVTERVPFDDILDALKHSRSKYPQTHYDTVINLHPVLDTFLDPWREKYIDDYFSIAKEIKKDKKKLSREQRREYLRKLVEPLYKLDLLNPSGENTYLNPDGTYPFIDEKIWIDKEIDIDNLNYDKQKYSINFKYSEPLNYFDPDGDNIIIWYEYKKYMKKRRERDAKAKAMGHPIPMIESDEGHTSIRKLYSNWLPTLTQDKIKSTDLLNQILVCFTIKRALNGDEEAIDKLVSVLLSEITGDDKAAEILAGSTLEGAKKSNKTVVKTIKLLSYKLHQELDKKIKKDYPDVDIKEFKQNIETIIKLEDEEIKNTAIALLPIIVSGFSPKIIINSLIQKNEISLPPGVEKFYFWYLTEYIPDEINKIKELRVPRLSDELIINYWINLYTPISSDTSWKDTPINTKKFNSCSFRPSKNTDLITWLFHKQDGIFYYLLKDIFWPSVKENNPFLNIYTQKKKAAKNRSKRLSVEQVSEAINLLIQHGYPKEHAEIFCRCELGKEKKTKVAKDLSTYRKKIHRICSKVRDSSTFKNPALKQQLTKIVTS